MNKIHCIGDSHTFLFSGHPDYKWVINENYYGNYKDQYNLFSTYWIGPALAYNFMIENTTTNAFEKIENILKNVKKGSRLLISMGEIDCRRHIEKQSKLQKKSLDETIKKVILKYIEGLCKLKNKGYIIGVLGLHYNIKPKLKYNYITRNKIINTFNFLMEKMIPKDIYFINYLYRLVKTNNIEQFYIDEGSHLNKKTLPHILKEMKLRNFINSKEYKAVNNEI